MIPSPVRLISQIGRTPSAAFCSKSLYRASVLFAPLSPAKRLIDVVDGNALSAVDCVLPGVSSAPLLCEPGGPYY